MWYRSAQQSNIFNVPHDMRALNLDKEHHKPLEEAKFNYLNSIKSLNPDIPEHLTDINNLWDKFNESLSVHPRVPNSNFVPFHEWRNNVSDDQIRQFCKDHYSENYFSDAYEKFKEKNPQSPLTQDEFENKEIQRQALIIYNNLSFADLLKQKYNLNPSDVSLGNPYKESNELMLAVSDKIYELLEPSIPVVKNNTHQIITFVTGYPGSGKSFYIEGPDNNNHDPIRETKLGLLIDPDEFQEFIPGYAGGMGSGKTLVYAVSRIKPKLFNHAIERGNNVVTPIVGGTTSTLLNETIKLLKLYPNIIIKIMVVPTSKKESFDRTLSRAHEYGKRIIHPLSEGNPLSAWEETKNMFSQKETDIENPDLLTKKILNVYGIKINKSNPKETLYDVNNIRTELSKRMQFAKAID